VPPVGFFNVVVFNRFPNNTKIAIFLSLIIPARLLIIVVDDFSFCFQHFIGILDEIIQTFHFQTI